MSETIKKRKWDQADQSQEDDTASPSPKQTKLEETVDTSKSVSSDTADSTTTANKETTDPSKAVSEAAARINAMLAQKGISIDEEKENNTATKAVEAGEFVKDIPINHLKNRYMLTRGATQAQIQRETGADVTTRGKYYPDKQLITDKEPPLYLHVSAKDQESLDKAVSQIEELIETSQVPLPGSGYPPRDNNINGNNGNGVGGHNPEFIKRPERKFHEKKIPVDIGGTPHFNLRAKIVGPHGAYVKHIQQETGSRVQLKGRGSGFYESSTGVESDEPLHVHISCAREEGLEAAVKLAQDLIDTVKAEAERGPPQYTYGRGGYNNMGHRGGYNGYNNHNYNNYNTSVPGNLTPATAAPAPTEGYNYDSYGQYYDYYGQQQQQQQQQYNYDPNSYYNYYDYSATATSTPAAIPGATAAAPPPPPPPTSPPPPPPPASSSPPPPPPPSE